MTEVSSYDHTVSAMEAVVDRCEKANDRNGYFAAMYLAVTRTVRRRAEEGRFADAARMERFVSVFAGRYLTAEHAWRAGAPCPTSWRAAFDAAARWRPIILQHLLLGMNAHINLDLGIAASDVRGDGPIEAVRADFDAINDVLGELVGGCQKALGTVSPWIGLIDRIGGRADDTLVRFSLAAARRQAWSQAVRLSALSGTARERAIAEIDRSTAAIAGVVEHPGLSASALLLSVRSRERAAPAEVMRLLAAVRPAS